MLEIGIMYHYTISFKDIPTGIDKNFARRQFDQHAYHLGGWPAVPPENTLSQYDHLPKVDDASHIVRSIEFNDQGDLNINFVFLNTRRGIALTKQYDIGNLKMIPVTDESGINIYRFDFIIEEK